MDKKITVDYVRVNFPRCVAFADECRLVFGGGVKLVYASENGRELGKRFAGVEVCMTDIDLTPPLELRRNRK